ncbi:MAG TPA: histidine kinase [Bacteroidales bacterium]|nr:histidine kinase [Bacteroidales bacterium]
MLSDIYRKQEYSIFRFSPWYLIIPIIIGLIITFISYPQGFLSVKFISFVIIYSLSLGIPFMKTYEYVEWKLEQYVPWLKKPNLRFFLTVFIEISIGILILIVVNYLIFIVIQKQEIGSLFTKTFEGLKYMTIFTILGIILINSSYFFKNWKQAAVNEEKLKREKLAIEFEALKNQVNPHFLFNSLTALSSLVYKNQDKAVTFIREFSNVFRYVLESREKEVVDIVTEKKLLESISYLYQIRHDDSLQIRINLSDATDRYIIPMALQMLLENAIKHNAISVNKPLMVEIGEEEDYIFVKNNLQPKKAEIVSNNIGLENIKSRYKYLSDKDVLVEISNEYFVVKIPVLNKKDV